MDPQSVAFIPHSAESWRLYNDLLRVQQVQTDHADRLLRLERRHEDDARMKSVWGGASPFPSVLSGTPQQAPIHHLKDFDDDSANLIGTLHLDPDEEPRRMGATSRANSVRFDESANQGHWSHASRSSIDFLPRSASSMGGLGMTERSSSHKSDGRASSVHSVRSAASGRASSINLDTGYTSPLDTPSVAPGLLILGPVPAIVRCWMNTNFKHDALLYAAVSTASYKSQLDLRLIRTLGLEDCVSSTVSGVRTIQLPVYFAEAIPIPASSRSGSPAPQVPSVTVDFNVIDRSQALVSDSKAIQVVIGSDVLRARNGDILFSSNSMTLYDDDQAKLSIPLVRPENEATFNSLAIAPSTPVARSEASFEHHLPHLNGLGQIEPSSMPEDVDYEHVTPSKLAIESLPTSVERPPSRATSTPNELPASAVARNSELANKESNGQTSTSAQAASSPSIWSNWRREAPSQNMTSDGSSKSKESGYQRRDGGIKVLRPTRTVSRTLSGASMASASPAEAKSRFFDEGKKRGLSDAVAGDEKTTSRKLTAASDNPAEMSTHKTRANPAGGASAFSWLKS